MEQIRCRGFTLLGGDERDLELLLEVVDFREAEDGDAPRGIPYDEWDGRRSRYRPGWCTVYPVRDPSPRPEGASWAREAKRAWTSLMP